MTAQVIVLQIRRVIVLEMRDKFVKAFLITAGGYFLLPIVLEGGLWGLKTLAALLLIWLLWAAYRLIRLARVGAYRGGAPAWDREDFGFAAGIVCAGVGMMAVLAVVPVVKVDEKTITDGPQAAFEYALEAYRADVGSYPTTAAGLRALFSNPGVPGWAGPYAQETLLRYIEWFDYVAHNDMTINRSWYRAPGDN